MTQPMLLGPNGRPIAEFKKASPPKLGPAFGDWAGRDVSFEQMPGSSVLQFDLSKLTLADYRAMRDHPQINASLCVLSFMMHGLDWRIEAPNKKMRDMIEGNLREVWTRLIRGMSQAFWAGYSPMVMEYENDVNAKDLPLAGREGYRDIELAKRYTTTGMATDQGKLGNVNAIAILAEALGKRADLHIANYGHGIEDRLTGAHETAPWSEFSYGVSNRGASIRIPWQVAVDKKGYAEDRRPNANMDPYVVARLITNTVCSDAAGE